MKFGASLVGVRPADLAGVACALEEAGFESLWVPEHIFFPVGSRSAYPYATPGRRLADANTPFADPWIQLAYAAAVTRHIRLATCIYILPLRHPFGTARAVQTLDCLSGGRVTLGVGVGWLEEEFTWSGQSFLDRGPRTNEIISVLRALWRDDVVEHHGDYYDFGPLKFEPKPVQQPIPILAGGTSTPALRRAGQLADGWIDIGSQRIQDIQAKLERLTEFRQAAGRAHEPFEITVTGRWDLDAIRRAADIGVTRVIASPSADLERQSAETVREWADRYFEQVVAKVRP